MPCPPPGDLPNPKTESMSLMSPALTGRFFPPSTTELALNTSCISFATHGLLGQFIKILCTSPLPTPHHLGSSGSGSTWEERTKTKGERPPWPKLFIKGTWTVRKVPGPLASGCRKAHFCSRAPLGDSDQVMAGQRWDGFSLGWVCKQREGNHGHLQSRNEDTDDDRRQWDFSKLEASLSSWPPKDFL